MPGPFLDKGTELKFPFISAWKDALGQSGFHTVSLVKMEKVVAEAMKTRTCDKETKHKLPGAD